MKRILSCLFILTAFQALMANDEINKSKAILLPQETKKPDLPYSKKAYFSQISKTSARIEVMVMEDGAIMGLGGSTSLKEYCTDKEIRAFLHRAVEAGGKKKLSKAKHAPELADVDVMIYADKDAIMGRLLKLMRQLGTATNMIYRVHFRVKDKETGEEGFLTYHLPVDMGVMDRKESNIPHHILFLANDGGPSYRLYKENDKTPAKEYKTLKDLETAIDKRLKAGGKFKCMMGLC